MLAKLKKYARKIPLISKIRSVKTVSQPAPNKGQEAFSNLSVEEIKKLTPEELRDYDIYRLVPERVRLEVSTVCQLRCAGCGFQRGGADDLGRGFLSLENFIKFCDKNPFVREIEISNYGEPFLNPNLVEIMNIAKERGISLVCLNGSNFNTVSDEQIRALVDTGFKEITLSIDGASQESYEKYRIGGDFNRVIENVKKLQAYKKEKGSVFPKLNWQYILMEHNELEIGKAKALAKELDIPIHFKLNWDSSYKPVNREYLIKETGKKELTQAEHSAAHKVHPFNGLCEQMFIRSQINWDGRLLGCCTRRYATFDVNVFEVGLIEAIRSPKYILNKECLLTVYPDEERYSSCTCYACGTRLQREKAGIAFSLKR